ncbi:5995_t:CDS:2, partial [Gigaspora rosea]
DKVAKEMLIEQKSGCQDYGIIKITNKMSNLKLEKQSCIQKLETKIESRQNTKKTTIQNLDCSKDAYKLAKPKLETQYKKAVYTFMLWDIPSEAFPGNKQIKVAERKKDYSNNDTSVNSYEQTATDKQKKKLREHRQENSNRKNQ